LRARNNSAQLWTRGKDAGYMLSWPNKNLLKKNFLNLKKVSSSAIVWPKKKEKKERFGQHDSLIQRENKNKNKNKSQVCKGTICFLLYHLVRLQQAWTAVQLKSRDQKQTQSAGWNLEDREGVQKD
jgi:hypothetical protein